MKVACRCHLRAGLFIGSGKAKLKIALGISVTTVGVVSISRKPKPWNEAATCVELIDVQRLLS
jgi:hypothetical protein